MDLESVVGLLIILQGFTFFVLYHLYTSYRNMLKVVEIHQKTISMLDNVLKTVENRLETVPERLEELKKLTISIVERQND